MLSHKTSFLASYQIILLPNFSASEIFLLFHGIVRNGNFFHILQAKFLLTHKSYQFCHIFLFIEFAAVLAWANKHPAALWHFGSLLAVSCIDHLLLPSTLSLLWAGSQPKSSQLVFCRKKQGVCTFFTLSFSFWNIHTHSYVQLHFKIAMKWVYIPILIFRNPSLYFTFIDLMAIENLQCGIKKA